jgi:hypothetical protein
LVLLLEILVQFILFFGKGGRFAEDLIDGFAFLNNKIIASEKGIKPPFMLSLSCITFSEVKPITIDLFLSFIEALA